MRIKGVTEQQIVEAAQMLGLSWENRRDQGNYHLGVLRCKARPLTCGERNSSAGLVCTRPTGHEGEHWHRRDGKIVEKWNQQPYWIHPSYRYRKKGPHAFFSGSDKLGGNGAVCFHGHKHFMDRIFAANPKAIIRTMKASYLGVEDFQEKFPAVGASNVGSMMCPVAYDEACLCHEWGGDVDEKIDEHKVTFGTLQPTGELANVRMIRQSDLGRCRFTIFSAEHYREDGSCKCDDPEHRKYMIKHWGYTKASFNGIPLRAS